MRKRLRLPAPGTVMGGLALFIVLSGVGYAATGGNLILGQPNTATSQTGLTSSNAGKALQITQQSTGTGATALGLNVPAGKTPFTVNSGTKVARLNADKLDGLDASGLGRIALASNESLFGFTSTDTLATATITVPQAGFVRLDGSVVAYDGFAQTYCTHCAAYVRVRDDASSSESPMSFAEIGAGTHSSATTIPIHWSFAASAGTHSYSLRTAQYAVSGGPLSYYNPVLIAQFVPFGGSGLASSPGVSAVKTAAGAKMVAVGGAAVSRSP